jgi:hypothetical protein
MGLIAERDSFLECGTGTHPSSPHSGIKEKKLEMPKSGMEFVTDSQEKIFETNRSRSNSSEQQ